jgi:hypothetical protein
VKVKKIKQIIKNLSKKGFYYNPIGWYSFMMGVLLELDLVALYFLSVENAKRFVAQTGYVFLLVLLLIIIQQIYTYHKDIKEGYLKGGLL